MDLVVDANIVMSTLISAEGKTFDLIFNDRLKLFAPEFLLEEIEKHKEEILSKSTLSEAEFKLLLSLVFSRIEIIPLSEFQKFVVCAEKITPDPNDTEYFALALRLNCAIWTNDKKLKGQDKIKIHSTTELIELL
jgi:predicted nucleic acid-binding protein